MSINPAIFKKYDIRGKAIGADAAITETNAQKIGLAFGKYLQSTHKIGEAVVGHDNRLTSPELSQAFIRGLLDANCRVNFLGMVATPTLYWYAVTNGNIGAAMITGSHLPANQNGFKLSIGKDSLYGEQIKAVQELVPDELAQATAAAINDVSETIKQEYLEYLSSKVSVPAKLRVVVDCGNGMAGVFIPKLLQMWNCDLIDCLYCEPDGNFPNHEADPQKVENVRDLSEAVLKHQADIGLAFDGDCDRVGVVDEKGNLISSDRILTLLAKDMLRRQPNAKVVADVLCSQVLFDEVEKAGGEAIMSPSGHSIVKSMMAQEGALLGGEVSGHIFIGEDYLGFDDGLLSAGRILQLVSQSKRSISKLDSSIPVLYSTPEYRPHCPEDLKLTVIQAVKDHFETTHKVNSIDGVRVIFDGGWGLLRASNTEEVLSLRFEANTQENAESYRASFLEIVSKYIDVKL